jgi:hypothetical protein
MDHNGGGIIMANIESYANDAENTEVLLNLSMADIYISPALTIETLSQAIADHEKLRIREFWDETIKSKRRSNIRLEGLVQVRRAGYPSMKYFSSAVQANFDGKVIKGSTLVSHIASKKLDDQALLLESLLPESRQEMCNILTGSAAKSALAPDFLSMMNKLGEPEAFVQRLAADMLNQTAPQHHGPRYYELLLMLWSRNFILLPQSFRTWNMRGKVSTLIKAKYNTEKSPLLQIIKDATDKLSSTACRAWAYALMTSSSIKSGTDISLDLVDDFAREAYSYIEELSLSGTKLYSYRSEVISACQVYRLLYNQAYPHLAVTDTRRLNFQSETVLRTDGKFRWIEQERPELRLWAELLSQYTMQLTTARISGQVTKLNYFGEYLLSLPAPPLSPCAVNRREHIYDGTLRNIMTFRHALVGRGMSLAGQSSALSQVRSFFDWYADYAISAGEPDALNFKNPVLHSDCTGSDRTRDGQTARDSLPSYILNEMKNVITENDFAFSRSLKSNYVKVMDNYNNEYRRVWYPAPSICLYSMLELPLRSHQGRWLDSGELDEFVYDVNSNAMIVNPSKYAIPKRQEAALRRQSDAYGQGDWFGLWVNTNKTALYDSAIVGYCIPYVSEKLYEVIQLMREWQIQHIPPIRAAVPYYGDKHAIAERKRIADKGPQVAPLFRDPNAAHAGSPISYNRLRNFYGKVLEEVQNRVRLKYNNEVRLVSNVDGQIKFLVDLHSLRVSGITAMIESGVPLEVVSQFVAGHATLVMTLHYLKISPLKIRALLAKAHEESENSIDFLGTEAFMDSLEDFAPFMLGAEGAGQGAGYYALQERSGMLQINSDGICPGTSCSTGGPVDSTRIQHGPVPGGQRCGLCRYWLTGPAHALGQVAAVNSLAYAIRKKGLEVAHLNEARLEAEDLGDQRKARKVRDRVDLLNRELAIDVEEWVSRHRFAVQSIKLVDQFISAKNAVAQRHGFTLITTSKATELKITLEQTHEFALLDQITQMADFMTGFPNREAELEKHNIISRMLSANGIKPFLLGLNEQQAREAGNMMSGLILQKIKSQDLDDVLTGSVPLTTFPSLAKVLAALATESDSNPFTAIEDMLSSEEDLIDDNPRETDWSSDLDA